MELYRLFEATLLKYLLHHDRRKGDWYFSLPPHLQPDSQRPGAWLGAAYVLYNSLEREERLEKKLLTELKRRSKRRGKEDFQV